MEYWLKQWNRAWKQLHTKKLKETDWDRLFNIAANAEQQGSRLRKIM